MASVNLDISSRLDITCRKNDTFSLDLNVKNPSGTAISLTDYEFKMEVRSSTDDSGTPVVASASVTATKNADSTTGKLNLKVSATNMNITAGTYVYEQNIQVSLAQKEIDIEDAINIRSLRDVNQAERLLIVRRKKRMKQLQEQAAANSQAQAQAN